MPMSIALVGDPATIVTGFPTQAFGNDDVFLLFKMYFLKKQS